MKELIRKLEALVEASKMVNQEMHGREDCKSCSLQESLEKLILEAKETKQ